MPILAFQSFALEAKQETSKLLRGAAEIGAVVAPISALGGVCGLVLAAFSKSLWPLAKISYGEWIGYSAALAGLFALTVEISQRAS